MSYSPPSNFQPSDEKPIVADQQDVELLLIRVPKQFDINDLHNVPYVPGQTHNFAVDDPFPGQLTATYQLNAATGHGLDVGPLTQAGSKVIVGKPVDGLLSVTKSYKVESKPSIYTLPNYGRLTTTTVPMPVGLQERFTPFGSGLPIHTPSSAKLHKKKSKRDRESTASSDEGQNRERKRRRKDSSGASSDEGQQSEKKRRRKDSSQDSSDNTAETFAVHLQNGSLQVGEEDSPSPKKHKKKHKKDKRRSGEEGEGPSGDAHQSNGMIEATLVDSSKKKKRKSVTFSQNDSVFVLDDSASGDKSITPQRLRVEVESSSNLDDSEEFINDSKHTAKLEKAKRKLSSGYSTADTSIESTDDHSKKKKKKKHKSKDMEIA